MHSVSIVLCSYNGEKYIQEQLTSIQKQSYPLQEIIVQDDGSIDRTVQIVQELKNQDTRIKLIQNQHNLGFNRNFEFAIQQASGDWIALSDQDDIWHPDKIKLLLEKNESKAKLIHSNSVLFKEQPDLSEKHPSSHRRFQGTDARQLFVRNTIEGHTILFHKTLLKHALPFPDKVYFDWWLGYCAAVSGGVQWVNQTLVWRRIHDNNQSSGQETHIDNLLRTYQAFANHPLTDKETLQFGQRLIDLLTSRDMVQLKQFLWKNRNLVFFFKRKLFLNRLSDKKRLKQFVDKLTY
jgi:glycosyltransferase involved in cell wall biosynthesis